MPKYDFNNTLYARFFNSREASQLFSKFINDPDIIANRPDFWKGQFSVDPMLSPRNADGRALFSASVRKRSVENMLDMRAPLGGTQPRDKSGLDVYTGPIPDFAAKGYVENGAERFVRQQMLQEYFGNDSEIVAQFADDVQAMVDEANQTISNMAAQILSKGEISYNHGSGIKGAIYKAPLPSDNFVNAGTAVWSDNTNCKLLDQMAKIEADYRERTGSQLPLKWQVTKDTFNNCILKNAQVIAYIANWRKVNDKAFVDGMAVNATMFNEAFEVNPLISPIEVIDEAQKNANTRVYGWAENVAVLRPQGYAGVIKRAGLLDKSVYDMYGSKLISKVYAQKDIFTIVNSTLNNGELQEWHTDLFVAAVPVLEELEDHIIVNTATAGN